MLWPIRIDRHVDQFFDLQRKATKLLCPDCGTCAMSVFLRCDITDWECLVVASCGNCGRRYDAAVLDTHEDRYRTLRKTAQKEGCPACGAEGRIVTSLCDRSARRCFFLIGCKSCGDLRET